MKAVGVFPRERKIELVDHPEPELTGTKSVRVRVLEVGVCGTDREIATYAYGVPPDGSEYLVLGHECLGEIVETGKEVTRFQRGDLVIPTVRRPCAALCQACRSGRQDFCFTGDYTERGIVRLHGFLTEEIVEQEENLNPVPAALRKVGVLAEPLTVTEKAWSQLGDLQSRLTWRQRGSGGPGRALVLGAGPVGILAAMKFSVEGYQVWVYSRGSEASKPPLVEAIGAKFIASEQVRPDQLQEAVGGPIDLIYEAMGAPDLTFTALQQLGRNGVFVFTGIPREAHPVPIETSALLYNLVLKNQVVLGTVNAAPGHFKAAILDLARFEERFGGALEKLITGRYDLADFRRPLFGNDGIKSLISI